MKLYEQIMEFQEGSDLKESLQENFYFVNSSANLFIKIKQYDIAEAILKPMIKKSRNRHLDYFFCLNNLPVVFLNMDKTSEAKTLLNEALNVANELYGENAVHPFFTRCLTNLSQVHFDLKNTEEANRFLQGH